MYILYYISDILIIFIKKNYTNSKHNTYKHFINILILYRQNYIIILCEIT